MRSLILLLATLFLFGCSQQQMMEKFSTPADQAVAKAYIADLQARRFDAIESRLDPSLKSPGIRATLERMAGLMPPGPPTSVKLVGANKLISNGVEQVNTTLEYQWAGKWLLCNVAIRKSGAGHTIVGFNVYPQKTSLKEQTRFTLKDRSPAQYAILAGAIFAFVLTLVALGSCIMTKGLQRKWLWILFIIFGVGLVSTNWTTGAVAVNPLYVSLFSAGAFAPLNGPWTVSLSLPLGAIVFLVRRRQLTR